jgi:hypothetical protein
MSLRNNPPSLGFSQKHGLIGLLILAILGFIGVIMVTRWGIGTSPDSIVYIAGARNLASGLGFNTISESGKPQAITQLAPFYSVALALLDLLGLDPLQGARILNAILFAGIVLLVGLILFEFLPGHTFGALLAPLLGASLILLPGFMVEIYSMAWSETLFIFLALLGFWILSHALENQSTSLLVGSAILIGLAFLTRYIGVVLVAAGICSIVLFSTLPFRRKSSQVVLFGFVSAAPLLLWLLHNTLTSQTATNRQLLFHPINREQVGLGLTTLGSWFLIPDRSSGVIKLIPYLLILMVMAAVLLSKYNQPGHRKSWASWVTLEDLPIMIRIIILFIPMYIAFLMLSLSFIDANTPLDTRILSPIYVTGVILVIYFLYEGLALLRTPVLLKLAISIVSAIFLAGVLWGSIQYIATAYTDGIGFTSRRWRDSPTLALLMDYPAGQIVYTNAPEALYLYTHLDTQSVPRKYESANQRPNDQYDAELLAIKKNIINHGGKIVYFDSLMRPNLPSEQEILQKLNLQLLVRTEDGFIYGIK